MLETGKNLNKRYLEYIRSNEHGEFFDELVLRLSRKLFFQSLLKEYKINKYPKGATYIYYIGELGIDASGLTRDFFECLGTYALKPQEKFFEKQGDHYRIHPESDPKMLKVYGKALANGLIHRQKIPISLCDSLIKLLLNLPLTDYDLKQEHPETYKSLNDLMNYSQEELESTYLNFTVNQNGKTILLKKRGDTIFLTLDNREEY